MPRATALLRAIVAALCAWTASAALCAGTASAAPRACPDLAPQRRPHFGDLHVHTAWSLDASTQQTRTPPAQAYRFARGEPLAIQPWDAQGQGQRTVRLARPLDFAAVTDHSELLGEVNICNHPEQPGYDSLVCRIYRGYPRVAYYWMNYTANTAARHGFCGEDGALCRPGQVGRSSCPGKALRASPSTPAQAR